jgi:hypothetical protein
VKVVPQPSPPPPKTARIWLANWERCLPKKFIIATTPSDNSLNIDVEIETTDTAMKRNTNTLVDCGTTGLFVDAEYVRSNNISTRRLTTPIPVYNVDGTTNEAGAITKIADVILRYKGHAERTQLAVTLLGKQSMILGSRTQPQDRLADKGGSDVEMPAAMLDLPRRSKGQTPSTTRSNGADPCMPRWQFPCPHRRNH